MVDIYRKLYAPSILKIFVEKGRTMKKKSLLGNCRMTYDESDTPMEAFYFIYIRELKYIGMKMNGLAMKIGFY